MVQLENLGYARESQLLQAELGMIEIRMVSAFLAKWS